MDFRSNLDLTKRILDTTLLVFKNNLSTEATEQQLKTIHGRIVVLYTNYRVELLKYLNLRESNNLTKKLFITLCGALFANLGKQDEDIKIVVLYHTTKQEALDMLRTILSISYLDNQADAIEEYLENVFKYVDYTNILSVIENKPKRRKVKGKKQP